MMWWEARARVSSSQNLTSHHQHHQAPTWALGQVMLIMMLILGVGGGGCGGPAGAGAIRGAIFLNQHELSCTVMVIRK